MIKIAAFADSRIELEEVRTLLTEYYKVDEIDEQKPNVLVFTIRKISAESINKMFETIASATGIDVRKRNTGRKGNVQAKRIACYLFRHRFKLSPTAIAKELNYVTCKSVLDQCNKLPSSLSVDKNKVAIEVAVSRVLFAINHGGKENEIQSNRST